jgi:hypothetical protein
VGGRDLRSHVAMLLPPSHASNIEEEP